MPEPSVLSSLLIVDCLNVGDITTRRPVRLVWNVPVSRFDPPSPSRKTVWTWFESHICRPVELSFTPVFAASLDWNIAPVKT